MSRPSLLIQADQAFELGRLYCDRGEYNIAVPHLIFARDEYFSERNYEKYLDCEYNLMRIYAEQEKFDLINETKEKLQDLVLKEGFELNSKTFYVLGLSAFYKGQIESAREYLQKSLSIALSKDNKEEMCKAIFGIANCYAHPTAKKYTEALKEIYNLEVFFNVYKFNDIKLSALFLNAHILSELNKYEEALEVLWKAYDLIKETKNMVINNYLLVFFASVYFEMGNKDLASVYINMAQKSIDPVNQVRLYQTFESYYKKIGGNTNKTYDIVFNETDHSVQEKRLGKVDFKNQFILLDLLRLFMQNQGAVFSKEYLVENVWKQKYDPAVHDNKIYVTIKRLRKMIEPDFDKPKYIFRAKNGYFMNKSAKVHIEH